MANEHYNYHLSLIRRSSVGWVIEPNDTVAHSFDVELSGKAIGDSYLSSKIEGELSYCIFLSGGVCHSDVYGWIITMNGWQILELDTYLQLAQEVWRELEQTSLKERDVRQLLHDMIEAKGLVPRTYPSQMDRNVEHNYRALPFTSMQKQGGTQVATATKDMSWVGYVAISMGVIVVIVMALLSVFGGQLSDGAGSDQVAVDSAAFVEQSMSEGYDPSLTSYADSVVAPEDNEPSDEIKSREATALFKQYLDVLSEGNYTTALSCFDFPVTKFLTRSNLSADELYQEMASYNRANPIQRHSILSEESLEGGAARVTFVWDRLMNGESYQRFLVTSTVKARETSSGWKLYSVSERSEKIEE